MMTGIFAARNLMFGERNDLWSVNTEPDYHEEALITDEAIDDALAQVFTRLDRVAFGVALGAVAGASLFLATLILVAKGGSVVGPTLSLLRQYFPGYRVSAVGSLLGLIYGSVIGFACGWMFAFLRNAVLFLYVARAYRKAQRGLLRRFFDYT